MTFETHYAAAIRIIAEIGSDVDIITVANVLRAAYKSTPEYARSLRAVEERRFWLNQPQGDERNRMLAIAEVELYAAEDVRKDVHRAYYEAQMAAHYI